MPEKTINNLVIVESPAKARTITSYLGKDFTVMSSVGHIRSIPTDKELKKGQKAIDTDRDFATIYTVDPDKKKTVAELKAAAKKAKTVWLATDEDREGEAIAWHLSEALGLDPTKVNRIVFHEITRSAIDEAIKNPRRIDMNLVKAQQARQILDRLVGFELSPVVWRKVPGGKSAGRVQSPAVRLLVEREREIQDFESSFVFKVSGEFSKGDEPPRDDGEAIKATLSTDFPDENAAREFLESLIGAKFTVADVETGAATRKPLPPFTTSTLQQDANARLGMSARTTMSLAQQLYQSGMITYMRTDSLNLSNQFLSAMGKYIEKQFGADYLKIRKFKTKSAGAQEAHEAIRPTDPARATIDGEPRAQKLYDLIRRRTLASQMADAKIERTTVTIDIASAGDCSSRAGSALTSAAAMTEPRNDGREGMVRERISPEERATFIAKGEVILFDGFLKMYGADKEEILPPLSAGDELGAKEITARQAFSRPPARYSEGSLVKKLEELGIGRPSTYATIIGTIQTRGYAEKGSSDGEEREIIELRLATTKVTRDIITEKSGATKGKLLPTAVGTVVSDFLGGHFTDIVDYDFTARVENELDEIAEDKLDKTNMLRAFYDPFHELIDGAKSIDRSSVSGVRNLGTDPKTGQPVFARIGRFGPMLQMGEGDKDKDKKPRFANFPKNARLETVTLDQALTMFQLPREVGTTEDGQEIVANIGRFGPYVKVGSIFVSIKNGDPFTITEQEARDLYTAKLAADAAKNIADFGDGLRILNGRFGAYVTDGKKNAKIPKGTDPAKITHDQAKEIIANAPAKKGRPTRRRTPKKS
ncbi:type I DNA topoisomerase [Candidatus Saccharibacteria bacterium]|nr:type I DNA topoisomerase [Candidatus Saccharibacteria bacterium]